MRLDAHYWIFTMAIGSTFVNIPHTYASLAEGEQPTQWGQEMVFEDLSTENVIIPVYPIEMTAPKPTNQLTAAEYAEQQAKKQERRYPATVNSEIRELIYLLQIRKFIKTFIPLPLPF